MSGWPDPASPGVPLNPEQNGAHVITNETLDYPVQGPWWLLWCAPERLWTDLFGNREPPEAMAKHRYVGPGAPPSPRLELVLERVILVPVEPTREMWAAGGDAVVRTGWVHHDRIVEAVWRAMLAAAPPAPGGEQS